MNHRHIRSHPKACWLRWNPIRRAFNYIISEELCEEWLLVPWKLYLVLWYSHRFFSFFFCSVFPLIILFLFKLIHRKIFHLFLLHSLRATIPSQPMAMRRQRERTKQKTRKILEETEEDEMRQEEEERNTNIYLNNLSLLSFFSLLLLLFALFIDAIYLEIVSTCLDVIDDWIGWLKSGISCNYIVIPSESRSPQTDTTRHMVCCNSKSVVHS